MKATFLQDNRAGSLPFFPPPLFLVLVCVFCPLLCACTSFATPQPIKVGAIFSLTGKATHSNRPAVQGVQIATEEINSRGGIGGQTLEVIFFDNNSSPIGSYLAATKAVQAGVVAIVGSSWSSHSLAVARVAQKNSIPMISPISTIPALTRIGDYIFRVSYNDDFQASVAARFAYNDLQARTALIIIDIASDFSISVARIFKETFVDLGGYVKKEIEYKFQQSGALIPLHAATENDADIVFLAGHDESGAIFAKLQQGGLTAIPIGTDGWDADSFFSLGGNTISKGYYVNHWIAGDTNSRTRDFVTKYRDAAEMKAPTALAYDAVHVLAEAIAKAGSIEPEKIRDSLHDIKNFAGVTGSITFDANGDATKKACIIEIRNGKPYLLKHMPDNSPEEHGL